MPSTTTVSRNPLLAEESFETLPVIRMGRWLLHPLPRRNPLLAEESFETWRYVEGRPQIQSAGAPCRNPLLAEESFETVIGKGGQQIRVIQELSQSPISRGKF